MGLLDCCTPCCPTTETVNVPGLEGPDGTDGTNGTGGGNAYTFTTADFVVPAIGSNVTVSVASSDWMVVGQKVITEGPATFEVISKPTSQSAVLEFKGYTDDVAPTTTVPSGSSVGPSGVEPSVSGFAAAGANSDITSLSGLTTPLSIVQGGTGANTETLARTRLGLISNANIADVVANAADTYLTGSALAVPTEGLKAGTKLRWRFVMTKTGAGVAAPIWSVRVGTAGTTADTAQLVFTSSAQTAAIDTGEVVIEAVLRNTGAAGVLAGGLHLLHNLDITGFSVDTTPVLQVTSAGFTTTTANLIIGVSVNPGAAGVFTHQIVEGELWLNN